jgi:hypothetical protein
VDLQFIQFSDTLDLSGAVEVPGMTPRTLEITGPDFQSAVSVEINDEVSPSFVVANKTTILAQVPTNQTKATIRTISVLSAEFTATYQSRIRFKIGDDPVGVTGLRLMMQTFLKVLFTTVGTDAFQQSIGGSALKGIGQNFAINQTASMLSDFAISVSRTVQQIRALQSRQTRLMDDEKLLSANLLALRYDANASALVARIELISQAGTRAITNLEL